MNRLDLHLHTTHSDGSLPPAAVLALAHKAGVTALAITDHDITTGIPEALAKDTATEAVDRFHQVWGQERAHLPISSALEAEIERLLGLIPLAQGR